MPTTKLSNEVTNAIPVWASVGAVLSNVDIGAVVLFMSALYTGLQIYILIRDKIWKN